MFLELFENQMVENPANHNEKFNTYTDLPGIECDSNSLPDMRLRVCHKCAIPLGGTVEPSDENGKKH